MPDWFITSSSPEKFNRLFVADAIEKEFITLIPELKEFIRDPRFRFRDIFHDRRNTEVRFDSDLSELNLPPFPVVPQKRVPGTDDENYIHLIANRIGQKLDKTDIGHADEIRALISMLSVMQTREGIANVFNSYKASCVDRLSYSEELSREGMGLLLSQRENLDRNDLETYFYFLKTSLVGSPLHSAISKGKNADLILPLITSLYTRSDLPRRLIRDIPDDNGFAIMAASPKKRIGEAGTKGFKEVYNHPEMMSRRQLLFFLQLPDLPRWIKEECRDYPSDRLCSTLSVAAECYAENEHLMGKNEINNEDVAQWISDKLKKHDPSYHTALYLFGRLIWTEFRQVAIDVVAPHLKKKLIEENPGGMITETPETDEDYFDFLKWHAEHLKNTSDYADPKDLSKLIEYAPLPNMLPDYSHRHDNLEVKLKAGRNFRDILKERLKASFQQMTPEGLIAFLRNPHPDPGDSDSEDENGENTLAYMRGWIDYTTLDIEYTDESFFHFDINTMHGIKTMMLRPLMIDLLEILPTLLKQCSKEELDQIVSIITGNTSIIGTDKWKAAFLAIFLPVYFEKLSEDQLADKTNHELVALSEKSPRSRPVSGLIKVAKEKLSGLPVYSGTYEGYAGMMIEGQLLNRYLKNTREGTPLIYYLLNHRNLLRTPELVLPYPDAVNPSVIKEFADHSDLYALLQITTLLQYLGYNQNRVFQEVKFHAEQAEKLHHPQMYPVGIELEQANYQGRVINPKFEWLLNVMVRGNDWETSHEITTARSYSPYLQSILLSLISKPKFGFLNADQIWTEQEKGIRASSMHVTLAIGREFDEAREWVARSLSDLSSAILLAYNTQPKYMHQHFWGDQPAFDNIVLGNSGISMYQWKHDMSLLDTQHNLSRRQRLEEKTGQLSPTGAHEDLIEAVWALGNAGLHHYMENRSVKPDSYQSTAFSKNLADIYSRFLQEFGEGIDPGMPLKQVDDSEFPSLAEKMKAILIRHTSAVKREIRSDIIPPKKKDIIIEPYRHF